MAETRLPEPWLRGTLQDVPPVTRAVLHALELAKEDLARWCHPLSDEELNTQPHGVASVAFQICHIARSVDRLLTYAEGKELDEQQLRLLAEESIRSPTRVTLFEELRETLNYATSRIRRFDPATLNEPRTVGRKRLPTTVAGLLIHVADHTQRHVGQAITTAKVVKGIKPDGH